MVSWDKPTLEKSIRESSPFRSFGRLTGARGILTARLRAEPGEVCEIYATDGKPQLGEVIGFRDGLAQIMPFRNCDRVRVGMQVVGLGRRITVPVGGGLLGRVINGLGEPLDELGPLTANTKVTLETRSPSALSRPRIRQPLETGIRVVDALLTFGLGQRIALLAGSGVGKSTFLGEIAKNSTADINVVALIGERGREVRPFLDDCLGPQGMQKSVVVVATSDEKPLLRLRAAHSAMAIANHFRSQGKDVLFLLDSITRLAMAQREIGLSLDEAPTQNGYTPSVFQMMADMLEQMGTTGSGSISSIINVLVDGDDFDEPISDTVRSIVDGHIVLDRRLAEHGHYPAVNVAKSLSRVFRDITTDNHQKAAVKLRDALATYDEIEDLLRIGAYEKGTSYQIDKAIQLKSAIDEFVQQGIGERTSVRETLSWLEAIAKRWD